MMDFDIEISPERRFDNLDDMFNLSEKMQQITAS